MKAHVERECELTRTPRVLQVSGMFDVPAQEKLAVRIDAELPVEERDWSVGLIVGPSGAGKSLLARELWPGRLMSHQWGTGALLDDFPAKMGVKAVTGLLTGVGLGTVPAWLRPYSTLSNGEAFRADMARLLAETAGGEVAVVDEFTSVVDRQIAQVASHTVQKAVRRSGRKLVAVTCHYDVVDWLQPDWILEMPLGDFTWRSVQPHPGIGLEVYAVDRSAWRLFAQHHYLSPRLHAQAVCYIAVARERPAAFICYLNYPHPHTRNLKMAHRLVVLPDWQGVGLAKLLSDWLGQQLYEQGYRYHYSVAHPAMIHLLSASPRWRELGSRRNALHTATRDPGMKRRQLKPRTLNLRSFEYQPPAAAAC